MQNKSPELEVAIKAAKEAGKILEKHFETELEHLTKEDKSILTIADKESEDIIKKIILEEFPEHSIVGEETGYTKNGNDYTWHIDPLDGTRNFSKGIPFFAVSIALERRGEIIVGVVYNPVIKNSLFYGEKGMGVYNGEKKISVSKSNATKATVTVVPNPVKIIDRNLGINLRNSIIENNIVPSTRNLGCTALDLSYVARGTLESTVQLGFNTYDFAAGVLFVEEAGGKVTKLDGSKWKFPENYFIASNGVFHDLLVEEVEKQKDKLS